MTYFWFILFIISILLWIWAFFDGDKEQRKEMWFMCWIFLAFLHITELKEKLEALQQIVDNLQ